MCGDIPLPTPHQGGHMESEEPKETRTPQGAPLPFDRGPGLSGWVPSPAVTRALKLLQNWEKNSSGSQLTVGGPGCPCCHKQHR